MTVPNLTTGGREIDTSPENFGWLLDSNDAKHDPEELRRRMERDGYLFLPGFFEREDVRAVRLKICEVLAAENLLDPSYPVEQARVVEGAEMYFRPDIANGPAKPIFTRFAAGPDLAG